MSDQLARARAQSYLALAQAFAAERIAAPEFRRAFLDAFKGDPNLYEDAVSEPLLLFFDFVESYEPDPELLKGLKEDAPDVYLDAEELRSKAREFVAKLEPLLR